ncbi:DUF2290 domain-containing protein [Ralstonia pseudosolanacearum]|uniref:DUF2290 domain-containing protein n=1 Tax=Ralstonia pseudosolanacearum TaxID=1310165 RepID=UPI001CB91063|nr:DUF2290 domain-containing protein [Ralstonia pseudosolanacearum]
MDAVLGVLIERGIADDQNFPMLRQLSATDWEVSFDGAEHVSIAMGEIDYTTIHAELSQKRSYNVKLIDGGLLQMMYRFADDRLIKHRLAYYPSPSLRPFQEDPEAYLRDDLFLDIVSRRIVPFPLRFDFDIHAAQDVAHPFSHLTLGDVQGCRIPVSGGLTPRWFTEFILRNFYQTNAHDFVGGLPAHRLAFEPTITDNERRLMHVVVPAQ